MRGISVSTASQRLIAVDTAIAWGICCGHSECVRIPCVHSKSAGDRCVHSLEGGKRVHPIHITAAPPLHIGGVVRASTRAPRAFCGLRVAQAAWTHGNPRSSRNSDPGSSTQAQASGGDCRLYMRRSILREQKLGVWAIGHAAGGGALTCAAAVQRSAILDYACAPPPIPRLPRSGRVNKSEGEMKETDTTRCGNARARGRREGDRRGGMYGVAQTGAGNGEGEVEVVGEGVGVCEGVGVGEDEVEGEGETKRRTARNEPKRGTREVDTETGARKKREETKLNKTYEKRTRVQSREESVPSREWWRSRARGEGHERAQRALRSIRVRWVWTRVMACRSQGARGRIAMGARGGMDEMRAPGPHINQVPLAWGTGGWPGLRRPESVLPRMFE
ncbi:uncharacterized protein BXZ73DRAFT_85823 [Epithele typhae]|uniref:uncharacterized protein n=1 Tax=Epithele typhae TaxID=378194 RepID=UPI0020074C87|nr:uncharacterized protein BXZ73DRAFT_85823 [Epithele typhae]KAH9897339.1 hypothetical protein BXZ73DRAFT_85823 [Epithele typhae]